MLALEHARDLACRLEEELHRELGHVHMRVRLGSLEPTTRKTLVDVYRLMRRFGYGRSTARMYVAGMAAVVSSPSAMWTEVRRAR